MNQQSAEYHMQMQRSQMPPQQQPNGPNPGTPVHHYPQTQPSPASDKNRVPPPSYNDSIQQQFVQQRQTPTFMSPPTNQQQGANYSMQPNQQMAMHQSAAANHYAAQLQHRVMSEIGDNVDELMATIGGDADLAEDFDLDSIELEPMRSDGTDLSGMSQQPQSVPPQQNQQHPGPSPHYYQPQSIPPAYNNMQQFANQEQSNYQMHPNMMHSQQGQMPQQAPNQAAPPTREQQAVTQKSREQQKKLEEKQLEVAMKRLPEEPHSPSDVEVPMKQQQQVANAIDSVMERVRSGKSLEDSGASSSSQPTPPPNKRKKASTAKSAQPAAQSRAQTQQVPVQVMNSLDSLK
jgi:hypothetical protein